MVTGFSAPKYSADIAQHDADLERKLAVGPPKYQDPFMFRSAIKTEEELAELRQRKKGGKKVEAFQRQQNDVRWAVCSFSRLF